MWPVLETLSIYPGSYEDLLQRGQWIYADLGLSLLELSLLLVQYFTYISFT